MKLLILMGCLAATATAGTYGGPKTSLEDIEREYMTGDKTTSYTQTAKATGAPSVSSPTKFGFVPQRTASSYAATKPKYQYTQSNFQVKKPTHKPPLSDYHRQQYSLPSGSYQHQYSSAASQQEYVQPGTNQKYILQYQQPDQSYEQYENVQYLTDNYIAQPESGSKQYYGQQPQYYYVQQSPSTAVESVLDPKAFQYVMFVPSYAANSIPVNDQKHLDQYITSSQSHQLPPITKSVAKYVASVPVKPSGTKSYSSTQYEAPSAKGQYHVQQEIVVKRNPKSLLDSYVPSVVQLEYLRQQGKSSYSTKNY